MERTKEECQRILSKLGFKIGISPRLVSLRLLSNQDKQEMLEGKFSEENLEQHIRLWIQNGMPDYAQGKTIPYAQEQSHLKSRKQFKRDDKGLTYADPFISRKDLT